MLLGSVAVPGRRILVDVGHVVGGEHRSLLMRRRCPAVRRAGIRVSGRGGVVCIGRSLERPLRPFTRAFDGCGRRCAAVS
ncbi:hypothetical protein AWC01_02855 [Mycobacterium doricum]|uniref:Uncharacterized protein n=1 Tax=Mycolicibacterium doricum TaxID=126673 RepID=A0A1X1TJB4_9MYCO|nr:hypothetical protein AWC01_02855 [Mycolicibacterium doricum]